jgi:hypothetical protein
MHCRSKINIVPGIVSPQGTPFVSTTLLFEEIDWGVRTHHRRSGPSVADEWVASALRVESSGVLGTETGVLNEVLRTFPQSLPPDKCSTSRSLSVHTH